MIINHSHMCNNNKILAIDYAETAVLFSNLHSKRQTERTDFLHLFIYFFFVKLQSIYQAYFCCHEGKKIILLTAAAYDCRY